MKDARFLDLHEDARMSESKTSGTSAGLIFVDTAEEVLRRLAGDSTPEAMAMVREAQELARVFRMWQVVRPADKERLVAIQRMFEVHRKAMEYLGHRAGPSST
jgi:hypothetical protein